VILDEQLARVPDATHFPTVPEIEQRLRDLHAQHRETTAFRTLGTSRGGQPISAIIVGNAGAGVVRHAVVTGTPHPNEPTGALGALALAELLVSDPELMEELGLQWHIVPCVDPDGAALNYGWYAGPYDRLTYAAHVYRPPFAEQYEWTFHRPDRAEPGLDFIPESRAIANLIDRLQPDLLMTMHNAEAGGLYSYVSRDLPGLTDAASRLAEATQLPLYQGAPEADAPILAPGLFEMVESAEEMLSSVGYAAPYGTFGVVCEPPMWVDPDTGVEAPSELTHAEVHQEFVASLRDAQAQMEDWLTVVRRHLTLDTARGRAVLEQARYLQARIAAPAPEAPEADARSTVAHLSSVHEEGTMIRYRCAGHILALLREQSATAAIDTEVQQVFDDITTTLSLWAETEPTLAFVGLGAAVRMHVGMALEVAGLLAPAAAGHR
jgi:hypothetical protein